MQRAGVMESWNNTKRSEGHKRNEGKRQEQLGTLATLAVNSCTPAHSTISRPPPQLSLYHHFLSPALYPPLTIPNRYIRFRLWLMPCDICLLSSRHASRYGAGFKTLRFCMTHVETHLARRVVVRVSSRCRVSFSRSFFSRAGVSSRCRGSITFLGSDSNGPHLLHPCRPHGSDMLHALVQSVQWRLPLHPMQMAALRQMRGLWSCLTTSKGARLSSFLTGYLLGGTSLSIV